MIVFILTTTMIIHFKLSNQSKQERDAAVKASEGAFEAYEILKEQLQLVLRERDLARSQV